MFDRKFILIFILSFVLISISAVCAAEDTQNSTSTNTHEFGDVKSVELYPQKLSTTYGSGKVFKVKAVDMNTKKSVSNLKLTFKVQSGKKYKTVTKTTDSRGIAKYDASKLDIGKHRITVNVKDSKINSKSKTGSVKIKKAKLTISAPKMTNEYNDNGKFKITIKNKESKRVMYGIKTLVKVFTGNKFKSYSLKTNKKGVVNIKTNALKIGSHKVTVNIKSTSKIKSASAKSAIKTVDSSQYVKLKVNGQDLTVKLENNKAAKALIEKLKKGNIKINAKEYGGFEKVGELGFSLPANDEYIKTSSGDLVLYNGDEISLFYESNSWEYTKLGKVQNVDNLKKILGNGDVTIVMTLK